MTTAAEARTILLEERKDMFVLSLNGKVQTVPLTPYTEVKFKHFNGNRVAYRFNEEMEVQETYDDDGIFNCTYKTAQMQIRKRDALAEAILHHYRCSSTSAYERLFQLEYADRNYIDLLKFMLAEYRQRLRFEDKNNEEAIYIDGSFKVDRHGNAYVRDDWEYRRICIVVQGSLFETSIETQIGRILLDETALTILAKTMFLLNPKLEDEVFRRQVPSQILAAFKQSRGKAASSSP